MSNQPSVYSYQRFSSPGQAGNTSIARQTELAARWAADHNLVLDTSLTMKDEGLSAFHGAHLAKGSLGLFLKAIEAGKVAPGSVLVIEQLDRLSRQAPINAQAILSQIITSGVTVVTAVDSKVYSEETLKAQPMDLVYSLLVMIRAFEESQAKSTRVKGALAARCREWIAGTWRGHVGPVKNDPVWLRRTKDGFEFHSEHAEAVRVLLSLYRAGNGAVRIVRELDRRGLTLAGGTNNADRVKQIVTMRALIGERDFTVDGERFVLRDYYPRLLSDEEFAELQALSKLRGRRAGASELPHVLTGLGITRCGYCGSIMVGNVNLHKRRAPNGLPFPGHRRIACTSAKTGKHCPVGGSTSIVPIERAIMAYCSDAFNLSRLLEGDSGEQERVAALARARGAAAATQQQIDGLMGVILADPAAAPAAFASKVKALETDLKAQNQEVERRERELATAAFTTPASASAWAELAEGVEMLDHDARVKARQLVADSFSGIEIARLGFDPSADDGVPSYDEGVLGIFLHGRRGSKRVIFVDRKTGKLLQGHDIVGTNATEMPPEKFAKQLTISVPSDFA